jgi:hypothetical protein
MEHVYDRDGGSYGTTEQNVFASPGSVIPGSATLTRFSHLACDSELHDGDSATVNDVRRGFFTSKIERSLSPKHAAATTAHRQHCF